MRPQTPSVWRCAKTSPHPRASGHPVLAPIFNCQTAKRHRPVFFAAPGTPSSLFSTPQNRGGWRAKWRNHCSVVPRSLSRTRAPLGAPSRRSSFRRPGTLCGGPPTCGRPPSASSWRAARSGHRVEPRRRPSACLRGTPAGAASGPAHMTPHESALWRTERLGLYSVIGLKSNTAVEIFSRRAQPLIVMAGLVPAIHVF